MDTWTRSLNDNITDAKNFHEAIANMRNDHHEELGLMLQVQAQATKALIKATGCKFQTQLKEVNAWVSMEKREPVQARRGHRSSTGLHHRPCSGTSSRPQRTTTAVCAKRNPYN
jgi:hypothetical protein